MRIPEFDKLRYRYEYGGESVLQICRKESYLIKELEDYSKLQGWEVHAEPDLQSPAEINEYYLNARKTLTVQLVKRAMVLFPQLTHLQDILLEQTITAVQELSTAPRNIEISYSNEISKLMKVLTTLQDTYQIYADALLTPANIEKSMDVLNGDTFATFAGKIKGAINSIENSISTEVQVKELSDQEASEVYFDIMKGNC